MTRKRPHRNFLGLEPPLSDYDTAQAIIIPVPYDRTMEWRTGARNAPRAIIEASDYLEFYDLELKTEIHRVGIHTTDEINAVTGGPGRMTDRIYRAVKPVAASGKLPVVLGGEHSITFGAVRAVLEIYPGLSVLQLDAHTDLRDEYLGGRYGDACVMRRVSELCPVIPAGIRSSSFEEQEYLVSQKRRPLYAWEFDSDGKSTERVLKMLTDDVYVTIDLDVFDPSVMPAVGTPEPGGPGWRVVLALLRRVSRAKRIVGFDVVELCPDEGPAACTYLAASLTYKMIGYALAGG